MRKSNLKRFGMVVSVVIGLVSLQQAFAVSLSTSWSAPVKSTLPTLQSVMHLLSPMPKATPTPNYAPPGSVVVQGHLMCGDQDVNNFSGGVNPVAPSGSKEVEFLAPANKPNVSLVFGYWIAKISDINAATAPHALNSAMNKVVPTTSGTSTWYPLAYDTLNVAGVNITPQPTLQKMYAINKRGGQVDLGKLLQAKAMSTINSLAAGAFNMPGAPAVSAPVYGAYFGLMACNDYDARGGISVQHGGNITRDMPDSLDIADFLQKLPTDPIMGSLSPTTAATSFTLSYNSTSGLAISSSGGGGPTTWNVDVSSPSSLYQLGVRASNFAAGTGTLLPTDPSTLSGIDTAMSGATCNVSGEMARWFEPFPMQVTCKVLKPTNFQNAYTTNDYGTMGSLLMQAGLAQAAENTLASNVQAPTARCFHPGQEYIDPVLASIMFPFQTTGGKIVALAPGAKIQMTHPEALFANINYKQDYCTNAGAGCTGSDFNTVFGMTAVPSSTVLAQQGSPGFLGNLAEILVPKADARSLMLEGGPDAFHASSTYEMHVGMISGGVPVSSALYSGSLPGNPETQSVANAEDYIPLTPGLNPAQPQPPSSGLMPNGLNLKINIRAIGGGSGCPVTYCRADGALPTFIE